MMDQLIVKNIVKKYHRQTVLDNISFTLEPAKIYGLLGRNGAGKTTLLNIMSNRIFPTNGEVQIGNEDVNNNDDLLSKIFLIYYFTIIFHLQQKHNINLIKHKKEK